MEPWQDNLDTALLAQCDVETFRSRGPGGQNVNRRETAVRLSHRPTGIVVRCQRERSQGRNLQIALEQLRVRIQRLLESRNRTPRVATRIPRGVRQAILDNKQRQSRKKALRKKPQSEEY